MVGFQRDWLIRIDLMQREMERLLDHFAGSKPPMVKFTRRFWEPAVDVYETANEIIVIVELAGINEDDIETIVHRDTLTIRGERRVTDLGIQRNYYQMEIYSGPFQRSIKLPAIVDTEGAKAIYCNGLIKITLHKSKREHARRVNIKSIDGGKEQ
jgi:HSP20 family protein